MPVLTHHEFGLEPVSRAATPIPGEELAVADVEGLTIDKQPDQVAVGDVETVCPASW